MKETEKRIRGPVAIKGQAADDPQMGCMVWMAHRRYFSLTPIPTTVCLTKGKRINCCPARSGWDILTLYSRDMQKHAFSWERQASLVLPHSQHVQRNYWTESKVPRVCVCVWVCAHMGIWNNFLGPVNVIWFTKGSVLPLCLSPHPQVENSPRLWVPGGQDRDVHPWISNSTLCGVICA